MFDSVAFFVATTVLTPENGDLKRNLATNEATKIKVEAAYESFSDVGEIRVWFASKILTPCRMH